MTSTRHVVRELVSELDYPMFIVTVAAHGERAGCLVGFTTQCSVNPPSFLACLGQEPDLSRGAGRGPDGGSLSSPVCSPKSAAYSSCAAGTIAFVLDPFDGASDPREQQFAFHRAKRMDPGHEA